MVFILVIHCIKLLRFSCSIDKHLLYLIKLCTRSLTIGQMQGKFQMVVVRHTGHAIQVCICYFTFTWHFICLLFLLQILQVVYPKLLQEDTPDEFATLVVNFISRNRIGPHGIEVCINVLSSSYDLNFPE